MTTRDLRLLALVMLSAAFMFVSCGKKAQPIPVAAHPAPVVEEPMTPPPPPPPPDFELAPPSPPVLTDEEIFASKTLDDLNVERPLADVFFDYDMAVIREDARPILQKNADWMRRWASTRVTVEGHCDERGTHEYNLALGERRAHAARQYLISLGIPADRILAVSMGKEAPVCTEKNETCWQQNRRGHFIITAK